ncbi:tyrosine-type recombinase/integrase [Bradyrhizobium cenepequi]
MLPAVHPRSRHHLLDRHGVLSSYKRSIVGQVEHGRQYDGSPLRPRSLTHVMSAFPSEWGMTPHQMRHTHASHMLAAKIHPKVVQERLGHSSIAITMDVYSHLMPNMQGEAAAAVDGVMRAAINKRADDVG